MRSPQNLTRVEQDLVVPTTMTLGPENGKFTLTAISRITMETHPMEDHLTLEIGDITSTDQIMHMTYMVTVIERAGMAIQQMHMMMDTKDTEMTA